MREYTRECLCVCAYVFVYVSVCVCVCVVSTHVCVCRRVGPRGMYAEYAEQCMLCAERCMLSIAEQCMLSMQNMSQAMARNKVCTYASSKARICSVECECAML